MAAISSQEHRRCLEALRENSTHEEWLALERDLLMLDDLYKQYQRNIADIKALIALYYEQQLAIKKKFRILKKQTAS
jgi:hypothetical protein